MEEVFLGVVQQVMQQETMSSLLTMPAARVLLRRREGIYRLSGKRSLTFCIWTHETADALTSCDQKPIRA